MQTPSNSSVASSVASTSSAVSSEPRGQQGCNWCWTLNNYTDEEILDLRSLAWDPSVSYCVWGKEIAPTTGTPHLQGFIQFKSNKRLNAVINFMPRRCAQIQKSRGTAHEGAVYCQKEGDYEEYGTPPPVKFTKGGQTTKKQWEDALAAAKEGRIDDIPASMLIRYYGTFLKIKKDYMSPPEPLQGTSGLWIYGGTGTGKSHAVHTQHPGR